MTNKLSVGIFSLGQALLGNVYEFKIMKKETTMDIPKMEKLSGCKYFRFLNPLVENSYLGCTNPLVEKREASG